jgi:hypothetical protein
VTGAKFEENDAKLNPERRPGHSVPGAVEDVDQKVAEKQERIRNHQASCRRLTWPEEIKTVMSQGEGFGTLSTMNCKDGLDGFPLGSIVGFAIDENGFPIFSLSGTSVRGLWFEVETSC